MFSKKIFTVLICFISLNVFADSGSITTNINKAKKGDLIILQANDHDSVLKYCDFSKQIYKSELQQACVFIGKERAYK